MRLVSTPESIGHGEVSLLAVLETLAAISLVFFLSAHLNTVRWLASAVFVAPLLLLRTEKSTRLAIEWIDRWLDWWETASVKATGDIAVFWFPVYFIGLFFGGVSVRLSATAWGALTEPVLALQAIPKNWSRVVLSMDSRFPPEFVPEHPRIKLRSDLQDFTWSEIFGVMIPLIVILFFPALMYRWSLKATSIIYAPLVFVLHTTFRRAPDLLTKLELIKRSDITRILALYAVCYVVAFFLKLVLMMNLPGFAEWWRESPVRQFAALYVAPQEIPKWQLASLTNCGLALGAWFFARHALLRIKVGRPWPEAVVQCSLGFATGLRTILALYTIACTGYLTLRAARGWQWPTLGEKWLPWGIN